MKLQQKTGFLSKIPIVGYRLSEMVHLPGRVPRLNKLKKTTNDEDEM